MKPLKVIPQNVVMAESVPFGQRYTYGAAHDINRMLEPSYFLSESYRLNAGDTMRICQLKDADIASKTNRVLAYIDVMIVESSLKAIEFLRETDIIYTPLPGGEDMPDGVSTERTYLSGDVKWRGPQSKWAVMGSEGVLLDGLEDKEVARKIAAGEIPIPV